MDIRMETRVIVKRGALFLVGKILYSHEYRLSGSPYDAWNTRDLTLARCVAKKIGGDLYLFNPIVGQLREVAHGSDHQH